MEIKHKTQQQFINEIRIKKYAILKDKLKKLGFKELISNNK